MWARRAGGDSHRLLDVERACLVAAIRERAGAALAGSGLIVDLGCGSGWLIEGLAAGGIDGSRLVGVEIDPAKVRAARKKCPTATILQGDAERLQLEDASADVVVLATVLSTVDEQRKTAMLAEAQRIVSPAGAIVVLEHRWKRLTRETAPLGWRRLHALVPGALSVSRLGVFAPVRRRLPAEWAYRLVLALWLTRSHYLAVIRSPHPATARARSGPRSIAMLVRNAGTYDTRVRKEAATLAGAGYDVTVLASHEPGLASVERLGDVEYVRIAVARGALERHQARLKARRDRARNRYLRRAAALTERRKAAAEILKARREYRRNALQERETAIRGDRKLSEEAIKKRVKHARDAYTKAVERERARYQRRVNHLKRRTERARRRYQRRTAFCRWVWLRHRAMYLWLRAVHDHREYWAAVAGHLRALDPAVVHAHDLSTLYTAWRYSRQARCALVYDSHELELHRNRTWTPLSRLVSRLVELAGIRRADRTITVGEEIADDLRRTYRIKRPAVVLNAPPLRTRDRSVAADIRTLVDISHGSTLVAYVGGIGPNRGLEYLIRAFAHLPPSFHLAVLGPRREDLDQPLRSQARACGVASRLHLLPPVGSDDVPATLRGASMCAIPIQNVCRSYDLCMPNKLFDALMAGLPLATANLRCLSAFVNEHRLGAVFDERDPESIAAALESLARRRPEGLRREGTLRGLQEAVAWERQEQVLLELYASLPA